jgi:hypothetical protein
MANRRWGENSKCHAPRSRSNDEIHQGPPPVGRQIKRCAGPTGNRISCLAGGQAARWLHRGACFGCTLGPVAFFPKVRLPRWFASSRTTDFESVFLSVSAEPHLQSLNSGFSGYRQNQAASEAYCTKIRHNSLQRIKLHTPVPAAWTAPTFRLHRRHLYHDSCRSIQHLNALPTISMSYTPR